MEALLAVLVKIWGFISNLFPAIIGSALSVFVGRSKTEHLTRAEIVATFGFGVIVAYTAGGAIIERFHIDANSLTASTIILFTGFMGMAALTEAHTQIPIAITALRKKFIGE